MATYSRANPSRSVGVSRRRPRNFRAQGQVTAPGMGNYSFNPPAGMSGRAAVAAGGRGNGPMGPGQRRVKRMQTQLAQLNQARTSGTKPLTQQDTTKLLALKERLGRPLVPWARAMIPGLPSVVDPETGRRVPGTPGRVPTPNPPYSRGGNRRQGPGGNLVHPIYRVPGSRGAPGPPLPHGSVPVGARGRRRFVGNFNAQAGIKRRRLSRFRPPLS